MRATSGSDAADICPAFTPTSPGPSIPARKADTGGSLGNGIAVAQGIVAAVTPRGTRAGTGRSAGTSPDRLLTPIRGIGRRGSGPRAPRGQYRRVRPGHRAAADRTGRAGNPPRAGRLHAG